MLRMCDFVFGDEYRRKTLSSLSDRYEVAGRAGDTPYGKAVARLGDHHKRTSCLRVFLDFCKSWFRNGTALLNETLSKLKKLHRFSRFRATQKTLATVADKYMGTVKDTCRVMLFGKASFRAQ